jgi:hypothetical protein
MPNLINRRKKKNKVPETVTNEKSDSDSSDYDFSSKLNSKYNVLPEELVKSKKAAGITNTTDDNISIRLVPRFVGKLKIDNRFIISWIKP